MRESKINLFERPKLRDPILIGGNPGVGFVADVTITQIIRKLKAEKFGEIISPLFKDIVVTTPDGGIQSPIIELYHCSSGGSDLIILYGNSQALTSYGQYELCGKILDAVQELGCELVVCLGELVRDTDVAFPEVYCTATDFEMLDRLMKHNLRIFNGQVSGISGLLTGLAKLRGISGFCLLAETGGTQPDVVAVKVLLDKLNSILGLSIDLADLEKGVEDVGRTFESMERERK